MTRRLLIVLAIISILLAAPHAVLAQIPGGVQVPGTGSLPTTVPSVPSKDALLQQAKGMVSDLTTMKSSGKLGAAQAKQVDGMLPKAQSLASELEKPQIPPSKLTQLATSLNDLQNQMTTLKGLVK
jgi:hypothetical protein